MKEELITFETAVLAKKKGFDNREYHCFYGYRTDYDDKPKLYFFGEASNSWNYISYGITKTYGHCNAPTQALLQRWLREKHNLYVLPDYIEVNESEFHGHEQNERIWQANIFCLKELKIKAIAEWDRNYEEALEKGLQEALKLI